MNEVKTFETEFAGRKLIIKTGERARQASGSCTVQYGDTVVLATVVMSPEPKENASYFPLMVEYVEKMYAAGKISGSRFIKRENRPSDEAILISRLIDRGLRPLFDQSIRRDLQVIVTVLSVDGENEPDIPAIIAASTAIQLSDVPWKGPLAGIRIGQIDGEWVINPSKTAQLKSVLDLTFSATEDRVMMVEAGAQEVDEATVYEAFKFGLKHIKPIIKLIKEVGEQAGKQKIEIPKNEIRIKARSIYFQHSARQQKRAQSHLAPTLRLVRSIPGGKTSGQGSPQKNHGVFRILYRGTDYGRCTETRSARGRPQAGSDQSAFEFGRYLAENARIRLVQPRGNASAFHRHARLSRRRASNRRYGNLRQKALHASLQFSPIFSR